MKQLILIVMLLFTVSAQAATYTTIQMRRDTPANWTTYNPVLAAGEPGCEMTGTPLRCTAQKIGDGVTAWGALPYSMPEGAQVDTRSFSNLSSAKVYAETVHKPILVTKPMTYNNLTINTEVNVVSGGSLTRTGSSVLNLKGGFSAGLFKCLDAGVIIAKGTIQAFQADWNGGDIKAAFGSYHIVELSDKVYTMNNQQVFLASTDGGLTYELRGKGTGSQLQLNNYTSGYAFYLNESAPGVKVLNFPAHPRFIMRGVYVDGSRSTAASFMWYNEATPWFIQCNFFQMLNGTNGTNYTDRISFQHVKWTMPRPGGWLHQQIEGDSFLAEDVFSAGDINGHTAQTFYLKRVNGGSLTALNCGTYKIEESTLTINGSHFENPDTDTNIRVRNSTVKLSGSAFQVGNVKGNLPGYSPVVVDDDPTINRVSNVSLEELSFGRYMHANSGGYQANDIFINNMKNGGRVHLSNLFSSGTLNTASTPWPRTPYKNLAYGVTIGASDAGLNAALQKGWPVLSSNAEIKYGTGGWYVTATQQPTAITPLVKPTIVATEADTTENGSSFDIGTTIYYTAYLTDLAGRTTEAATEVSITKTTNSSVKLTISGVTPFTKIRILRGDSTGNYNRRWDFVPLADTQVYYDDKWLMNGVLTTGLGAPFTPPATNTTVAGVVLPTGNLISPDGVTSRATSTIQPATFTGTGLNDLTSGGVYSGSVASESFTVTVSQVNAIYSNPVIATAGTGYTVNNILTITTGSGTATAQVTSVDGSGGVTGLLLVSSGYNYSTTGSKATTGGTGTGCTVNLTILADNITWQKSGGSPAVTFTSTFPRNLADGVTIQFGALAGHHVGDQWIVNVTSSNPLTLKDYSGANIFTVDGAGAISWGAAGSDGFLKVTGGAVSVSSSAGIASYTWATVPAASSNTGIIIRVSDIGTSGSLFISNGTNWRPVTGGVVLAQSAVANSISYAVQGTTQTTLASVTIPAGLLGPNGSVRIRAQYSFSNNSNSKIVRAIFGGTTYSQTTITTSNYVGVQTLIANRNSASSQFGAPTTLNGPESASGASPVTSSVNTASAVTIQLAGQCAATGDTITLENYSVEISVP